MRTHRGRSYYIGNEVRLYYMYVKLQGLHVAISSAMFVLQIKKCDERFLLFRSLMICLMSPDLFLISLIGKVHYMYIRQLATLDSK